MRVVGDGLPLLNGVLVPRVLLSTVLQLGTILPWTLPHLLVLLTPLLWLLLLATVLWLLMAALLWLLLATLMWLLLLAAVLWLLMAALLCLCGRQCLFFVFRRA